MILGDNNIYSFSQPTAVVDYYCKYDQQLRESGLPLVVDYGSSECRMGWAGQNKPALTFRNALAKSRKENELQIGNGIVNIEAVRQTMRSPFDRNVITHFEAFETLVDYGLSRLGLDSEAAINHPLLFTESLGNPNAIRHNMSQVLFELYSVPSLAYGVDSLFSFQFNQQNNNALVVSFGHQSINIIPVLDGVPHRHNARRINLGGFHLHSYMQKILQLRYQNHSTALTFSRIEDMFSLARVSSDFFSQLRQWKDPEFYERNEVKVQLPFVPVVKPPPTDPEVLKARRQELGRRLMEINAKKRESKMLENIRILEQLNQEIQLQQQGSEGRFQKAMVRLNLSNPEELVTLIAKTQAAVDKAKEAQNRESQREETATEPEVKRKREDMCETERVEFDSWISDIKTKLQEIREKKAARAQRRKQLAKRRTAASQERMRIISQLARNNKEDDNFGMDDSDWDVYKKISRDAEDSDSEEETLRAQEYESVLKEHSTEEEFNRNSLDWHQVHLSTELIMVPEILFQPSIIGIEQAGLAETIQFIFTKYSADDVKRLSNNVFLTGGIADIPGLKTRLENELQEMLPYKSTFKVTSASDPLLDSWRGASQWADNEENQRSGFMSRAEYEEYGEGFLKTHFSSNIYTPTPATPPPPSDTPATPPPPTDTPSTPPLPTVVAGAELPT